ADLSSAVGQPARGAGPGLERRAGTAVAAPRLPARRGAFAAQEEPPGPPRPGHPRLLQRSLPQLPDLRRRPRPARGHLDVLSVSSVLRIGHFAVMVRLSKCVCASAFDHRPTLPASLKVSSLASRSFLPSREHSILSACIAILMVCHSFTGTLM